MNMKENWHAINGSVEDREPILESSQDKQKRLNCYMGFSVDNWSCYADCAFWNGKRCTKEDE